MLFRSQRVAATDTMTFPDFGRGCVGSLWGLARSSSEEGTRSRGDAARDPRRTHEPGRGSSQVEKDVDEVEEPQEGLSQFAIATSFDAVNTPWSPLRRAASEPARARSQRTPAKLVGGPPVATSASGIGGESPGEDEIPGEHRASRWPHGLAETQRTHAGEQSPEVSS